MITIKSEDEIDKMRKAGKILATLLTEVGGTIRPGMTALELDRYVDRRIVEMGGIPAFKGYRGYQHATCISINEQVVHGIPTDRVFQEGDIVGVDVGAIVDGYYADAARTFPVGNISKEAKRLIDVTREALACGIEEVRHGAKVGDISHAVQQCADREGYGVVRELYGHGIGTSLHEEPLIPNYGERNKGVTLKAGMVIAIEPMFNMGTHEVRILPDGWTIVTRDEKWSAHFENTVLVRRGRAEVLTVL